MVAEFEFIGRVGKIISPVRGNFTIVTLYTWKTFKGKTSGQWISDIYLFEPRLIRYSKYFKGGDIIRVKGNISAKYNDKKTSYFFVAEEIKILNITKKNEYKNAVEKEEEMPVEDYYTQPEEDEDDVGF